MKAIVDKDSSTHAIVDKTTFYLGAMAFVTFLILFVLVVGFPGFIINPLSQFADGLQAIGEGNYDFRLDLKTSEEFAHLSDAFNTLATSLSERKNAGLTRVLAEESRIKALIEETPDAVIGINEKQEVLFMNTLAIKISDLVEIQVVGKPVAGLIKDSPLLKAIIDNTDPDEPLKVDQDGEISYFKQKSIEIVAPYTKVSILDAVQYSGYTAGMIYILREVPELKPVSGV
jgi:NtrC-family two-component system sensor histidine kinase KinB